MFLKNQKISALLSCGFLVLILKELKALGQRLRITVKRKNGNCNEFGQLRVTLRKIDEFSEVILTVERGEIASVKEEYPGLFIRYKTNILSSQLFDIQTLENSCSV